MNERMKRLMEMNHIASLRVQTATNEELESAIVELAQNQSDLEDAIVELANMIGGEDNG